MYAALSANTHLEMDYLLRYIRHSACTIDSQGARLDGLAASAYFQRQYHKHRDHIHNIEEFIRVVATKSQRAGHFSMVTCQQGTPLRTVDWLQRALEVYRLQRRY